MQTLRKKYARQSICDRLFNLSGNLPVHRQLLVGFDLLFTQPPVLLFHHLWSECPECRSSNADCRRQLPMSSRAPNFLLKVISLLIWPSNPMIYSFKNIMLQRSVFREENFPHKVKLYTYMIDRELLFLEELLSSPSVRELPPRQ